MPSTELRLRRGPWLFRVARSHPRLFSSGGVGVLVTLILTAVPGWRPGARLLVGWDIGIALYLGLVLHMMASSDIPRIRRRAATEDEGRFTILAVTVGAALASLVAIIVELGSAADGRARTHLVLVVVTIFLSWAVIHTIFALHYAHEFYGDGGAGGLAFPGEEEEPDYWDFIYFAFVVGMTSQVSDVGITSREIRRTATAHGIVAFMFNAALLALTVNIAASAI
jgi:uncharacterized membrane protein